MLCVMCVKCVCVCVCEHRFILFVVTCAIQVQSQSLFQIKSPTKILIKRIQIIIVCYEKYVLLVLNLV